MMKKSMLKRLVLAAVVAGSFAAWLSHKSPMHAYIMPGHRYDIGDLKSYEDVKERFDQRHQ